MRTVVVLSKRAVGQLYDDLFLPHQRETYLVVSPRLSSEMMLGSDREGVDEPVRRKKSGATKRSARSRTTPPRERKNEKTHFKNLILSFLRISLVICSLGPTCFPFVPSALTRSLPILNSSDGRVTWIQINRARFRAADRRAVKSFLPL